MSPNRVVMGHGFVPSMPGMTGAVRLLALVALAAWGPVMAQADATLDRAVQAVQAGRLEQARQIVQPLLREHPDGARAHFIEAELLAHQGQEKEARAALQAAEQLAPGLPFVRAEAVLSLRRQLGDPWSGVPGAYGSSQLRGGTPMDAPIPWGVIVAVAAGAMAAWVLTRLGRPVVPPHGPDVPDPSGALLSSSWSATQPDAQAPDTASGDASKHVG